jgi:CheY-like chemotaxis protein/HPt (histidine-containing phosphotransfer) domain-containing protein
MLGIGSKLELPTVLLIDDDPVSREVTATMLTLSGYLVHTAESGAASLQILDAGQCVPQVILMDAQMPHLSGLELIVQLRARSQARIFTISASQPESKTLAASNGFLLKPFNPETLRKTIDNLIPIPQAPVSEATAPVLSAKILAQFREMMPEPMVREIYTAVISDLKKRMTALEKAIACGDSNEVRRIGHGIKGGCGMAGAAQVAQLGAALEAGSDHLDDCAAVLRDLHSATLRLESILNAEFPA